jgi:asparagine synthase (glutamine-hydrolysing)
MCSIFAILDIQSDPKGLRKVALEMSKLMRHRGPDWSGIYADDKAILAHERLAIVDIDHGAQPLLSQDGNLVLAVNGEIYNHKQNMAVTSSINLTVYLPSSFMIKPKTVI